ncbi:MAG TPA: MBL fold metallo-hydrolase, partial [Gemmatimonadales bacterium]|nr:MBL fold metallo-hydrolase [Gemmatimonadales bacterium]
MTLRPLLLLPLLVAGTAAAQAPPPLASYARARATLERAIAALGGDSALAGLRTYDMRYAGETVQRHQSRRPEPPYDRTTVAGRVVLDFAGRRIRYEQESGFPGGFRSRTGFVNDGREAWLFNPTRGTRAPAPAAARAFGGAWQVVQRSPHWLVLTARERAASLRELGPATVDGAPHDAVGFATADGRAVTLYVSRRTGLPTAWSMLLHDPSTGDAEQRVVFGEWRREGGVMVPGTRRTFRAGELLEEVRHEIAVNAALPDSLFTVPAQLRLDTVLSMPTTTALRELAPGVHLVVAVGGSNALVVEFADHLVVVEPYGDDGASRAAIAAITKALPGKPIRYIATTHHHDDHSGGVRAYLAAGATLLTTAGNRDYFLRFARARGTLPPDAAELAGAPAIETFRGRTLLADSTRRLELIDLGPGPHAQEMVVAWLPEAGILFQGDMLNAPWDGSSFAGNA